MTITITWKGVTTVSVMGLIAAFILFRYFLYIDSSAGCRITILPSWLEFSNLNVQRSIRILKHASPPDYQDLCMYVKTIDPNLACAGFEGGCFYPNRPRSISVSTSQQSAAWTVGVLVHETCHAKQFHEDRPLDEGECYEADSRILKRIAAF
ncbi:MAG: hypothetical protein A3A30_04940 [Candidatus Terrybacteria bacterium RIFCSPLOWO2_01_FULL_48_14]|nr:MAG: hypothetical protein A3A30_04940 [Candidatus Terrybacteria bacterium RIFCSPLOWO2_01_FULL_48_14]